MGLRTHPRNPEVRTAQPTPRRASGECSNCQDLARTPNNAASPAQRDASSQPCGQRALGRLAGAPVSLGTTGRLPHAAVRQLGHTSHSVAYHGPPAREAKQQLQRTSLGLREPGARGEALVQKGGDKRHRGAGSHDQPAVRPAHRPRPDGAPHTREPATWHHGGAETPWRDAPLALAEPRRGLQSTPSRRRPRSSGDSSTGRKRARGAEAPPKPEREPDGGPPPPHRRPVARAWPDTYLQVPQNPVAGSEAHHGDGVAGAGSALTSPGPGRGSCVPRPPLQAVPSTGPRPGGEQPRWQPRRKVGGKGGIPGESPPAAWHLEAGGARAHGLLEPVSSAGRETILVSS